MAKNKFGFNTKHLKKGDVIVINRLDRSVVYYVKISYNTFISFCTLKSALSLKNSTLGGVYLYIAEDRLQMDGILSSITMNAEVIYA